MLALSASVASAAPALTVTSLHPTLTHYGDLIAHQGQVQSMLIRSVLVRYPRDGNSDSAESMTVTFNKDKTKMTMDFHQSQRHEYSMTVNSSNNSIVEKEVYVDHLQATTTTIKTFRFTSAGCPFAEIIDETIARKEGAPGGDTIYKRPDDAQILCDSKQYPVRRIPSTASGDQLSPEITWVWSADHTSVKFTAWETTGKMFYNAKGLVATVLTSGQGQEAQQKYTYTYDSKGNWTKRVKTVSSRPDFNANGKWSVTEIETVNRELKYW